MSDLFVNTPFPRAPLIGAATLVGMALVTVTLVRITGVGVSHIPDAPAVVERVLRFEDRPDGSIAVYDTAQKRFVKSITGSNGFLRGTLRGLARERKREGIGPERPFRLIGRADGSLTLEDPSTGRRDWLTSL